MRTVSQTVAGDSTDIVNSDWVSNSSWVLAQESHIITRFQIVTGNRHRYCK